MFDSLWSPRGRHRVFALAAAGAMILTSQVAGPHSNPAQAQTATTLSYDSGPLPFTLDEILGDGAGNSEGTDPTVIMGNDAGEPTTGNIQSSAGTTLSPIDSSFTTDELDFFGATPRDRDGDITAPSFPADLSAWAEGYAGVATATVDSEVLTGLELSDVETDLFKAGAPLGTWAAGLGGTSVKASTEQFGVLESILTCHQTYPYDFWADKEDYDNGEPSVPTATQAALAEKGLSCVPLTNPNDLVTFDGGPIDFGTLIPNEDSVISDMGLDPDKAYSVTKKDDGKLLFRWGTSVKKPTDIRFQKTIDLPAAWTDAALAGEKGYRVTSAQLVLRHNITNNPNDQIRPEDWENEAATGRLPNAVADGEYLVSTVDCYEGNGSFIPEGTKFKYPNAFDPTIPAADLQQGYTPAWYTTIQRDPFEWSYRQPDGTLIGSHDPIDLDAAVVVPAEFDGATLVSGPRWRMTSNKFGQNLPGLEIPSAECTAPPYQKGETRYDTGEFTTTTINLLDWAADEAKWDDAVSPLAYSGGWIANWDQVTIPGQINIDTELDAARCASTVDGNCVTDLGTTLTDGFDVSFYVKGDIKPLQVYDVQLLLEYDDTPVVTALDYGDAPAGYGTLLADNGARHSVNASGPLLGTVIDAEGDGLPTVDATGDDVDNTDDEDGVIVGALQAGVVGTAAVTLTGTGYINGWVDFDADGSFDDGEQVITDATADGSLSIDVPADANVGSTIARFRVSDATGVGPTGLGGVGEVEDYVVDIAAADVEPEPAAVEPFTTIPPTRVLDTRDGEGFRLAELTFDGTGPLVGGNIVEIPVRSGAGLPVDAKVAAINITTDNAQEAGFITVFSCDTARPDTSNLNFPAGQPRAGMAFAPISSDGDICLYSHTTTDVIVDVVGYTAALGSYDARTPLRISDTRIAGAPVTAGSTLRVPAPTSAADAFAISVVSTESESPGFLTAYACSVGKPTTSTVNYETNDSTANLTIVPNGEICVYAHTTTHVLVDVHGEFSEPVMTNKVRLVDTRLTTTPTAGSTTVVDPAAFPALAGSTKAAVNLTATEAAVAGFFTVWNCNLPKPTASNINYVPGQSISNLALLDTTSSLCVYAHTSSDLIVDLIAVLS